MGQVIRFPAPPPCACCRKPAPHFRDRLYLCGECYSFTQRLEQAAQNEADLAAALAPLQRPPV